MYSLFIMAKKSGGSMKVIRAKKASAEDTGLTVLRAASGPTTRLVKFCDDLYIACEFPFMFKKPDPGCGGIDFHFSKEDLMKHQEIINEFLMENGDFTAALLQSKGVTLNM